MRGERKDREGDRKRDREREALKKILQSETTTNNIQLTAHMSLEILYQSPCAYNLLINYTFKANLWNHLLSKIVNILYKF